MIQRYDCTNGGAQFCQGCYEMTPDADGDYVTYADHLAALAAKDAEIAAERDEVELKAACIRGMEGQAVRLAEERNEWQTRAERAEAEAAGLRADAERWRAVSAMMTHEHRADAVGWTLGALLPGDDPDAAIDAARAGGEG